MIKIMLLVLGVVFITDCEVQKTEKIPPPEQGMPDYSHRLEEVCVNGVVYYYRSYGHGLTFTPKVVKRPLEDKGFYETC
ncbi:MAG: hypothetical protein GOVbin2917_127 [Prokaryotic dsDNA virus sp.]|jgi:hypothetical protein|nr:MAG: hypothetical protein GOVbin2917_127 [Prokaryotic dsDNA virus sp.]|tara:strand:+ start:24861 stop:25097 length:237 start_codon:yes stop_codon:yes gene_type:complete